MLLTLRGLWAASPPRPARSGSLQEISKPVLAYLFPEWTDGLTVAGFFPQTASVLAAALQ